MESSPDVFCVFQNKVMFRGWKMHNTIHYELRLFPESHMLFGLNLYVKLANPQ